MDQDQFQTKLLGNVDALSAKIIEIDTARKAADADVTSLKSAANSLVVDLNKFRAEQAALKAGLASAHKKPGTVTEDCARTLGAIALCKAIERGTVENKDRAGGLVKDILGMEAKTALASSDIPLPVGYSGEVVELVAEYGAARKFGTVYPLGNGVVNLPRLKTDTTFTVLTIASAITEKSPQTEWVTFTPEKFGGMVRLPSEIDEDSIVPLGQFIARYAARNLARVEDWNFFMGTGTVGTVNGDIEGLCVSTVSNSKTIASGTLGSPSEFTLAHFRSVRSVVDAPALARGAYYMHPSFEQKLANLNTGGDHPYNANGIMGATLDGYPIRWVDVMLPYLTSDVVSKVHVLFGDASYQYLGVRGGVSLATSTEAGFATDEILIRAMERFTIGLMATGSMGGLITHSS